MSEYKNALGLPIGFPVENWEPRPGPPRSPIQGRYCHVQILDPSMHGDALFEAFGKDKDQRNWTYLPYGPFSDKGDFMEWLHQCANSDDPLFHAIMGKDANKAVGLASYLRIEPGAGVVEVGHIHYSPLLQNTSAATEAMYLLMRRVFDELGYRRYEWKCDALNRKSRIAASRLGFTFEGVFRQATLYKSRNRDTAWYSIIDSEWPRIKTAFESWLSPDNFDRDGCQLSSLSIRHGASERPIENT